MTWTFSAWAAEETSLALPELQSLGQQASRLRFAEGGLTQDRLRGHKRAAVCVVEIGRTFARKFEMLPLVIAYRDMCCPVVVG